VEAAIGRGVNVRLLLEGEPYMGMPPSDRETLARLQRSGADVRVLRAAGDGFKRYQYNHAKYAVADGRRCLVMSDNWTKASIPSRPATGNRGWGVIADSEALAAHLTRIFEMDCDSERPDSAVFDASRHMAQPIESAGPAFAQMQMRPAGVDRLMGMQDPDGEPQRTQPDPIQPRQIDGPMQATVFTAPEHALLQTRGICGLIQSAERSLDVLQNSIELYWEIGERGSLETTPDLFLMELAAAARRGIKVRVLLDGSFPDASDPRDNGHTRDWLQGLASTEKLDLEARVLDRKATGMGIHDKGLIIDGRAVLISSINWSENSPLRNRELGLVLESPAVADYFAALFDRDWAGGK
jgi:phosphatidylserine/phosphatidylglycerophosphate/cardiolipin synthase-like enzyme